MLTQRCLQPFQAFQRFQACCTCRTGFRIGLCRLGQGLVQAGRLHLTSQRTPLAQCTQQCSFALGLLPLRLLRAGPGLQGVYAGQIARFHAPLYVVCQLLGLQVLARRAFAFCACQRHLGGSLTHVACQLQALCTLLPRQRGRIGRHLVLGGTARAGVPQRHLHLDLDFTKPRIATGGIGAMGHPQRGRARGE